MAKLKNLTNYIKKSNLSSIPNDMFEYLVDCSDKEKISIKDTFFFFFYREIVRLNLIYFNQIYAFLENNRDESINKVLVEKKELKGQIEEILSDEQLLDNCDVLVSAVTEMPDLFCADDTKYPEGILLVPIHTRGFQNCDLFLSTYPTSGGLMCQYAAKYGKPILAYRDKSDMENAVEEMV